jgi:hypothetical protein
VHAVQIFVLGSKNGVAVGHVAIHCFDAGSYAGLSGGHALQVLFVVLVTGVGPAQATVHVVPPPEL